MVFAEQIQELLYTEECVIIPGMGAFITQYHSAEIREDSNNVSPPSKELGFNSELTEDDGLLVSHLSAFLGKPNQDVEALIAMEVSMVFDEISSKNSYHLKGLGLLSMSKDGLLSFKADLGLNLHLDSFGLSSFTLPGLELEKPSVFSNPIIFRQQPNSKVKESLPGTKTKKESDKYTSVFIGIALLTFVVILLVPYNARVSDALFRHPASLGPLPSLVELDPPIEDLNMSTDEPVVQPAELELRVENPEVILYPVVAGSFQSRANAEKLLSEVSTANSGSRIEETTSFYRVILCEFESLQEAESKLPELQRQHAQLSLWIKK